MRKLFFIIFFFITSVCEAQTDSATYYYNLGVKKMEQKNYYRAIEAFNKSLKCDSTYCFSYYKLGIAIWESFYDPMQLDTTYYYFDKAIKYGLNTSEAYTYRAESVLYEVPYKKEHYVPALEDIDMALQLDSTNFLAYYIRPDIISRIITSNGKGNRKSYWPDSASVNAIEDYTKCIYYNPIYTYAYIGRAFAKIELGDTISGCQDFLKAEELGDINARNYYNSYCK